MHGKEITLLILFLVGGIHATDGKGGILSSVLGFFGDATKVVLGGIGRIVERNVVQPFVQAYQMLGVTKKYAARDDILRIYNSSGSNVGQLGLNRTTGNETTTTTIAN